MRMMAMLGLLLAPLALAQQDEVAPAQYRVEARVWSGGDLRGEPQLDLQPGNAGRFVVRAPESSWRISVEVEPPSEHEGAEPGALWLEVGIEQRVDGDWLFLTDTMLGTPAGEPGRISVVEDDESGDPVGPERAMLYIELTARPLYDR